jgi:hypothetical protein
VKNDVPFCSVDDDDATCEAVRQRHCTEEKIVFGFLGVDAAFWPRCLDVVHEMALKAKKASNKRGNGGRDDGVLDSGSRETC